MTPRSRRSRHGGPSISRAGSLLGCDARPLDRVRRGHGVGAPPVAAVAPAPPAPSAPPSAAPVAPTWTGKGVDVAAMDRSVSPGADFFAYANGAWLRATEIPADRSGTGAFVILDELSQRRTRAILDDASAATTSATGDAKKAGDYYATFMDEAAIEAKGTKPARRRARAHREDRRQARPRDRPRRQHPRRRRPAQPLEVQTDHFLGLWVEQDLNDPSHIAPYLLQGGLGMPDRSYYLDETPRHGRPAHEVPGARRGDADARRARRRRGPSAARVFALERKIAEVHAPRVDSKDVKKANNPWSAQDFATRAPGIDWTAFFKAAGLDKQPGFIVWHPGAITGLAALVKSEPLESWKDYLAAHDARRRARYLPKAFVDESFAFYGTALSGTPQLQATLEARGRGDERRARTRPSASSTLSDTSGPERKHAIEAMVNGIIGGLRAPHRRPHVDEPQDQGEGQGEARRARRRRGLPRSGATDYARARDRSGRRARELRARPGVRVPAPAWRSSGRRPTGASGHVRRR